MPLAGERVRARDITGFEVGFVEITANPANIAVNTATDIPGLSVDIPVVAGRLYQCQFTCRGVQSTVATDVMQLRMLVDGTEIDDGFWICSGAGSARWKPNLWGRYLAGATGLVTAKMQYQRGGTGNATIGASATSTARLWVIDAGTPA